MSYITVDQAVELLQQGQVVGVPTETVYGLAGRIDSEDALKRIFSTKQRPFFDPLIVHIHDPSQVKSLALEWPEVFEKLAKRFWPGPLTLVTRKTDYVSPLITSGLETVAIRCPRHPQTLEILRKLDVPLAAPSANRFGRTSPTRAQHVENEFDGQVAVVDGGDCEVGLESTVVDAQKSGDHWMIRILRPGGVSRQEIQNELSKHGFRFSIERAESSASPGHLKAHYQPAVPVVILDADLTDSEVLKRVQSALKISATSVSHLGLGHAPEQAARRLYQDFRELSQNPKTVIAVRRTPQNSGWEALWDRIERASSLKLN